MKAIKKPTQSGTSRGSAAGSSLSVRVVVEATEVGAFDRRLAGRHYLGSTRPVGDFLRQVVEREGQEVAQVVWGAAALKLKDHEQWTKESEPGHPQANRAQP